LLFAQVLSDEIASHSSKRLDAELGISFGEPASLEELHDVTSWISSRFGWITTTVEQLSMALNVGFIKAVGESGEPEDLKRIVHLAKRIGDGYEQLLDWKLQFLRVSCGDEFETLMKLVSEFSSNAIQEVEEFSANLYSTIESHIKNIDSYEKKTVVTITLTLTVPDTEPFSEELSRLGALYGL
jgi:hypothetical protein